MKRVLVLGSTGGIGSACCEIYLERSEAYEVWGVARNPGIATNRLKILSGDLRTETFRSEILKTEPNIIVAAFGAFPDGSVPASDVINEFAISIIDLYEKATMTEALEDFVVISSLSGQVTSLPHVYQSEASHQYILAKRMLSDFFRQTMLRMKSRATITLIEPGFIRSRFANIQERSNFRKTDDVITKADIQLIEPRRIAEIIYRATSDPDRFSTSITVFNRTRFQTATSTSM